MNFKVSLHGLRRSLTALCCGKAASALHLSRFPIYYSTSMAKSDLKPKETRDSYKHVAREYVHSLRGKFKGKGLLKALMTEKQKERRS